MSDGKNDAVQLNESVPAQSVNDKDILSKTPVLDIYVDAYS